MVTDNLKEEPQYKYGICINLKSEKEEEIEEFLAEYTSLSHNIMLNPASVKQSVPLSDSITSDGNLFMAYFDNEADAENTIIL